MHFRQRQTDRQTDTKKAVKNSPPSTAAHYETKLRHVWMRVQLQGTVYALREITNAVIHTADCVWTSAVMVKSHYLACQEEMEEMSAAAAAAAATSQ